MNSRECVMHAFGKIAGKPDRIPVQYDLYRQLSDHCVKYVALFLLLVTGQLCLAQRSEYKYKIAIIGNPANPDIRYDDVQLTALKKLGFNTIQLNIAWGARPADEPLNLEDILYVPGIGDKERVDKRLSDIKLRAKTAKAWGFRTLFHFGAPRVDSLYKSLRPDLLDVATEKYSISKKEVVDKYVNLLKRLKKEVPELDDIQIYTFDQEAWIANEFGDGPTDRGIPLSERLPGFLQALTSAWAEVSPGGILWWEPWEMSAGQIYACIPELPKNNFGLFLHSNIAEVQLTRPVDVWFKNMVRLLSERNIPVVGELFLSSANQEVEPLDGIAAPRLIAEELDAMAQFESLSGVKEYYGMIPDRYDPNLQMAAIKLANPLKSNHEALKELAKPYGNNMERILAAWETTAMGLSFFPWDATWRFTNLPKNPADIQVFHKWDIAHIMGSVAPSPSWKSTRRSLFMVTENEVLDPWFFEDVELRCSSSSAKLQEASTIFENIDANMGSASPFKNYVVETISDLKILEQTVTAIRCYCREANLAWLMRKYIQEGQAIPATLITRFEDIMKIDIANQKKGYVANENNRPTAEEMLGLFRQDPALWATNYLVFR